MGRFDLKKLAGDAVTKASDGLDAAEAVAGRAGMTKRNGEISKFKVARKVLLKPAQTARDVLDATAAEIESRKLSEGKDAE